MYTLKRYPNCTQTREPLQKTATKFHRFSSKQLWTFPTSSLHNIYSNTCTINMPDKTILFPEMTSITINQSLKPFSQRYWNLHQIDQIWTSFNLRTGRHAVSRLSMCRSSPSSYREVVPHFENMKTDFYAVKYPMIKLQLRTLSINAFCIYKTMPAWLGTEATGSCKNLYLRTHTGQTLQRTASQRFSYVWLFQKHAFNYAYMHKHYKLFQGQQSWSQSPLTYSERYSRPMPVVNTCWTLATGLQK